MFETVRAEPFDYVQESLVEAYRPFDRLKANGVNTNLNKFSLLPSPKGEGQDEEIYITTFWVGIIPHKAESIRPIQPERLGFENHSSPQFFHGILF